LTAARGKAIGESAERDGDGRDGAKRRRRRQSVSDGDR
jgi:hypothetical protein